MPATVAQVAARRGQRREVCGRTSGIIAAGSRVDPSRRERLFLCRDQIDEFMAEMAVPEGEAVAAAEVFVATAERPPGVTWESDW